MSKSNPYTQVKRLLSRNSNTSGGSSCSSTVSHESADRQLWVKRFVKSSSQETDTSDVSEDTEYSKALHAATPRTTVIMGEGMQSMPDVNGGIILDDIKVLEKNGTRSLPPSVAIFGTNTAHLANFRPKWVESTTNKDGSINDLFGISVCHSPDCNTEKCIWHRFVLTHPHCVIWDPLPKTIVLRKNGSPTFGFKCKMKKHEGPPVEVYSLVTKVSPAGVAWPHLLPGDWIRSINGTAVTSAQETFSFECFTHPELHLVIQRPESLRRNISKQLQRLIKTMNPRLQISTEPKPLQQFQPHSPGNGTNANLPFVARGTSHVMKKEPMELASPELDSTSNVYPFQPQSPGEHIPLMPLKQPNAGNSSYVEKCCLPRIRVIICGNRSGDFVRRLVAHNSLVVDTTAHGQCFQFSIFQDTRNEVKINTWPEPIREILEERKLSASRTGHRGFENLRQCCLNLELFVFSDENFFHHCSSWLITSTTLVIVAFDVLKLMNQPEAETSQLASLVHSILASDFSELSNGNISSISSVGQDRPMIRLFGIDVSSGATSTVTEDEVQAMLWTTEHGLQLMKSYSLDIPAIAQPNCLSSMASARSLMFLKCLELARRVWIHPNSALLLDYVVSCPYVQQSSQDLISELAKLQQEQSIQQYSAVIEELITIGNLIPQAGCRNGMSDTQHFILPFNIFSCLSNFLIKTELDRYNVHFRDKWFRLISTAYISHSNLSELLAADSLLWTKDFLTIDILERLGVIFQVRRSRFCANTEFMDEATEYIVPYFVPEYQSLSEPDPAMLEGHQFELNFQGHCSCRTFYNMMSAASCLHLTETCEIVSRCLCILSYNGVKITAKFNSTSGAIYFSMRNSNEKIQVNLTQLLEKLLKYIVPSRMQFTLLLIGSPTSNNKAMPGAVPHCCSQHFSSETSEQTEFKGLTFHTTLPGQNTTQYPTWCFRDDVLLSSLPWSVFKTIAVRLNAPMAVGSSWREVAEMMGKSIDEICAYENLPIPELPAMIFLKEIKHISVVKFLGMLEELKRPDVCTIIQEYFESIGQSPTLRTF